LTTKALMLWILTTSSTMISTYIPVFCLTLRWNPHLVFHIDILSLNIAPRLFCYKQMLQCLNIKHIRQNLPRCPCSSSQFIKSPIGQTINGNVI
jgi:hypothetical protein